MRRRRMLTKTSSSAETPCLVSLEQHTPTNVCCHLCYKSISGGCTIFLYFSLACHRYPFAHQTQKHLQSSTTSRWEVSLSWATPLPYRLFTFSLVNYQQKLIFTLMPSHCSTMPGSTLIPLSMNLSSISSGCAAVLLQPGAITFNYYARSMACPAHFSFLRTYQPGQKRSGNAWSRPGWLCSLRRNFEWIRQGTPRWTI